MIELHKNSNLFVEPRRFKGADAGAIAAQQEQQRAFALSTGQASIDKAFTGFDKSFYDQRAQAYTNYQMPLLMKQYGNTRNQLGFQLSNQGLTKSSAGQNLGSQLNWQMGQNQQQVANQAQGQANTLQQNVEGQRNALYSQLASSQNPSMAATSALNTAQAFSTPSAIVPIGQMFSDYSQQYLAKNLNNTYNNATANAQYMNPVRNYFAPNPTN